MTPSLLLFTALFLLRILNAQSVELLRDPEMQGLLELGVAGGVIRDLFVALFPWFTGRLLKSLGRPLAARAWEVFLTLLFWLICAANSGNFLFFGGPLRLAVALSAHEVAWDIREVIAGFLRNPFFLSSTIAVALSMAGSFFRDRRNFVPSLRPGILSATLPVAMLFPFQQIPVWTRTEVHGSILSDQPVLDWYQEAFRIRHLISSDRADSALPDTPWKDHLLDFKSGNWVTRSAHGSEPSTHDLRQAFGLDPNTLPNILFIVSESARALEFLGTPATQGTMYPKLRERLGRKGVTFDKTLTSASWTIHGLYQLLCGRFDAFDSQSIYRTRPYINETCLPQVLRTMGYQTYSLRAYHRYFDGAFVFESSHGIQNFFDRTTFAPTSPVEDQDGNEWGLADEFFFQKVGDFLPTLKEQADTSTPFFAYVLPVGGHAPWKPASRFPISESLSQKFPEDSSYQGYLSRIRAYDDAVSKFIDRIDQTPELKNTAIFIVGDHGTRLVPRAGGLNQRQIDLLTARVLGAVTTPGMKQTLESKLPVHQVDFPWLAARLAGANPPEDWMGTLPIGLQAGRIQERIGTPWIDQGPWGIRYITSTEACFSEPPGSPLARTHRLRCHRMSRDQDLLLGDLPEEIPETPEMSQKVRGFIQANHARINSATGLKKLTEAALTD